MQVRRLEVADQIISHGTSDNDYELTVAFPNVSTDVTLNLPAITQNRTVIHDGSTLDADNVGINAATSNSSPADADEILIYSQSDASNRKVSLNNLKSYIDHDHSSSLSGGFDIGDGAGAFVERQMSGGATMDSLGAVTIAKDVTTDGTCEANKNVVVDSSRNIQNLGGITADGDISTSGDMQADNIAIGGSTAWRLQVNSGNLELQKWDGASYQTHQIFT